MGAFSEWRIQPLFDGYIYTPPEGMQRAAIRVHQCMRPIEPLRALGVAACDRLRGVIDAPVIDPPEALVTFEGEGAAMFSVTGSRGAGARATFLFGVVLGDDFYDRIDAYCADERDTAAFRISLRSFLLEHKLVLGAPRARWFFYEPPRGWRGRGHALRAEWYPPDYPRHASRLCVAPALPCQLPFSAVEAALVEQLRTHGFEVTKAWPKTRLSTDHGLSGQVLRFSGRWDTPERGAGELWAAIFLDEQYAYHLRLETVAERVEEERAVFLRVLHSARPVPVPAAGQADALLRALSDADAR